MELEINIEINNFVKKFLKVIEEIKDQQIEFKIKKGSIIIKIKANEPEETRKKFFILKQKLIKSLYDT